MLKVTKNINGNTCTVSLEGKVDMTTSMQLEEELTPLVGTVEEIVLDLSKLVYISSAGLRVFIATQKRMKGMGHMVIRNVQTSVMEIFTVTGMEQVLTIEK
ncbi:MAG: STAS domain-containing protein [Lachnospiraceae bacterium]|nr:STAS domain-containing protein [Lachnospiraceae bacterium]